MLRSPSIWLAAIAFLIFYFVNRKIQRSKLPPGPPRLPIIGNLLQAPKEAVWVTYEKWVEQYGPLVAVDFCGTNVIIIGDHETAHELLDKRANIYSSRPRVVMAQELVCKGRHILFKPFGENFLLHQRLEAPVLSPRASACYTAIQDLESKQLLKNLLGSNNFYDLFERFTASVVYSLTFGMRVVTGEEWQLKTSHECIENLLAAGQTGAWIVDALPVLNYLPGPLAPWKKTAEAWYQKWANLHMANYTDALERDGWNWAKDFTRAKEAQGLTDMDLAWEVGILCDGGVETTSVQLQIFLAACVTFPEFISKAQSELDRVVGDDRLPEFHDIVNLPYIQAIVEENFRWRHLTPPGIPHAALQEDHYKGYRIPKGSIVVALFSAMRKDPQLYDNPEEFRPERWLGKSQPNNFGYGRRVCPGRFIARNSLTIAIARMLWAFNIRTKDGKKPNMNESFWTTGMVSGPKSLEVVFEPRSPLHKNVIEDTFEATEKDITVLLNDTRKRLVGAGVSPRA